MMGREDRRGWSWCGQCVRLPKFEGTGEQVGKSNGNGGGEVSLRVEAWARVTDGNNEMDLLIFWFWYCPQCMSEAWKSGLWVLKPMIN